MMSGYSHAVETRLRAELEATGRLMNEGPYIFFKKKSFCSHNQIFPSLFRFFPLFLSILTLKKLKKKGYMQFIRKNFSDPSRYLFPFPIVQGTATALWIFHPWQVKTRPPDSVVYQTRDGWVLQGSGGEIMKEAQRRLNFTPVISIPRNVTPLDQFGYDISPGNPQQFHQKLRDGEWLSS